MSHPWSRLPDEKGNAYSAFCYFLNMGAPRQLKELVSVTEFDYVSVRRWSSRYKWFDRVAKYDEWKEEQNAKIAIEEKKSLFYVNLKLLEKCADLVSNYVDSLNTEEKIEQVSPSEGAAFIRAYATLCKTIGVADDRISGEEIKYENLSDEEMIALNEMMKKCSA